MRKFALIAVFALTACAEPATDETMVEEEVAAEEPAPEPAEEVAMAVDGMPMAGTFEITNADGETYTQVVNEDGTYTNTMADGSVVDGMWSSESPDQWCGALEGEGVECSTEMVDENGVWTSTSNDDPEDVTTIVRLDG
ncbi:hypothetical protein [Aurantiacibacter poecillastricola]|uniref:hypothetical protein n=1 Tax=Aurantiacibacter poecillastricola TaxID=3064385 RepID=UPI00274018AB|nr:hypothetical protein [Aurantiacibacter sp. 219JJ12-13]MDP5262489.1 hypothetical protein [Aurantiacibacter sp. 219JJ12-13]